MKRKTLCIRVFNIKTSVWHLPSLWSDYVYSLYIQTLYSMCVSECMYRRPEIVIGRVRTYNTGYYEEPLGLEFCFRRQGSRRRGSHRTSHILHLLLLYVAVVLRIPAGRRDTQNAVRKVLVRNTYTRDT
jgi:hypothetical protein